jgi:hypothetical protein
MLEDYLLDLSFVAGRHVVAIGFFQIKILSIQPVFTFLLSLSTMDVNRFMVLIGIEKQTPA